MAAGDEPVRFNRKSADLIGRTIKEFRGRGRGELPLPKRRRGTGDSGRPPIPQQLAMITGFVISGTTPHYDAPYDSTFTLPATDVTAVVVYAVLLKPGMPSTPVIGVDNPDSLAFTDDALRIVAIDVRREGVPAVGDIVRVWTSDGREVSRGESAYDTGVYVGQHAIYCESVNETEGLRGLDTWNKPTSQLFYHEGGSDLLEWVPAADFVGGTGDPGPPGTPGDTVVAGYGIDTSGTGTVTIINDPTEWSGWSTAANTIQFFFHDATATLGVVTDPSWKTFADSDTTKNQMWWRKGTSFVFETTTDYGGSATEPQFLVNWGAGNGGEWQWKSATGYNAANKQLPRNNAGAWEWVADTRPASLVLDTTGNSLRLTITLQDATTISGTIAVRDILNVLQGYTAANDQSIGHDDSSGVTEWQDDGACT